MLGDGIKQTTTTTGTGNLTLSAVTGFTKFSDVFALNQPFGYGLLDSNGQMGEQGIGYLSASNTLVRARVSASLVSGVYTDEIPSAINLSGTTTVICTPHAAMIESMMPTVDGASASVGRWVGPANRTLNNTTAAPVALRCYYYPFLLRTGGTITSLGISVTAAGAGGTVARAGIYACKADGYIGAQLATTGDLATDSTGIKTGTLSSAITLPPGMYYVAIVCSGTPTLTCWSSSLGNLHCGSPLGFTSGSVNPIEYRYEALGSAVLPSTAASTTTGVTVGTNHIPAVFVGVS